MGTTVNRCPGMVDNEQAPQTHLIPCGFDETEKLMMVCCPDEMVEEPDKSLEQEARFPKASKPRKCQDASKLCRRWKSNGGCDLDKDIELTMSRRSTQRSLAKLQLQDSLLVLTTATTTVKMRSLVVEEMQLVIILKTTSLVVEEMQLVIILKTTSLVIAR